MNHRQKVITERLQETYTEKNIQYSCGYFIMRYRDIHIKKYDHLILINLICYSKKVIFWNVLLTVFSLDLSPKPLKVIDTSKLSKLYNPHGVSDE